MDSLASCDATKQPTAYGAPTSTRQRRRQCVRIAPHTLKRMLRRPPSTGQLSATQPYDTVIAAQTQLSDISRSPGDDPGKCSHSRHNGSDN